MAAEVRERTGNIRGVRVRRVDIIVAGHTVEQVLSFDVAEAEAVHGRSFDGEMDNYMQMGMFAMDRISADGTMHQVASAVSYALDGRCIRTAKIEHCKEIEPMSAGWRITRPDGSEVSRELWSCVPGTPPISHAELLREIAEGGQTSGRPAEESLSANPGEPEQNIGGYSTDSITRFLRGVGEHVFDSIDTGVKPDRRSARAGSLGDGYHLYHLWYSHSPWDEWDMSYRIALRSLNKSETDPNAASWQAYVGFTYSVNEHEDLEEWVEHAHISDDQTVWTGELVGANGQVEKQYRVIAVPLLGDALDQAFADMLAETLTGFIKDIRDAVDEYVVIAALSDASKADGKSDLLPEEEGNEEGFKFFDVLSAALSRVLLDLAIGPPETHHREWILVHLIAFIHDEAAQRRLHPEILSNLEWFHKDLVRRARPVEPPI